MSMVLTSCHDDLRLIIVFVRLYYVYSYLAFDFLLRQYSILVLGISFPICLRLYFSDIIILLKYVADARALSNVLYISTQALRA